MRVDSIICAPVELVCTGFEAFGEHDYNPSWDVARHAADQLSSDQAAEAIRLPVEFETVRQWASDLLDGAEPKAVVQFGLGESRTTVDLESTGRNVRGCRADEGGESLDEPGTICSEGPNRIRSTAPVDDIRDRLRGRLESSELPGVSVSDDAGDYVCNALYYHTLRRVRSSEVDADVLFVHVPRLERRRARRLGDVFGELFRERLRAGAAGGQSG